MYRALVWGFLAAWPYVAVGEAVTARRQINEANSLMQSLASKTGEAPSELSCNAMFVRNNAQRSVYNWIQQSDETHTTPYWKFRSVLSERYPFLKPFKVLYLNAYDPQPNNLSSLQIDLEKVKEVLSDTAAIPAGTYISLDLEGKKWSIYSNEIARPNPGWINTNVIAAKAGIITAIKAMRPDCFYAFYAFPESNGIAGTLLWSLDSMGQRITEDSLDELEIASRPVIDASDFIAPDLYWYNRLWKSSDVTLWVKKVVDRTRKYYPDKKIIPFTSWVLWEQITPDMMKQSYQWSPAAIAQVTVAGPDWRQFLDALSDAGINDIILYNDGTWMPWDPHAPWWVQTCDWASTPRKSSFNGSCNGTANPGGLYTRSNSTDHLPTDSMGHSASGGSSGSTKISLTERSRKSPRCSGPNAWPRRHRQDKSVHP
jgi:hypothetical protein